ncbi:cold shock domain-containing protein [Streptosporangium sp. NBC_01639]|uniref:cold shock domain-containing protein n=1 Tax=Streptosporangium sp. NBC_01639 TaxID=2975948 RepID=UPI003869D853|nr:cold shock domain-containing protein [Streptosporangium sp. NBC_01639]
MTALPAGRGDAFVRFSAVAADGYRTLREGDAVGFDIEEGQQEGFQLRALNAREP